MAGIVGRNRTRASNTGPERSKWGTPVSTIFGQSEESPTPREQQLIALIRRGLRDKEIAYELNISESTVHAHIRNIMRKYGLHNRTQIAVMFTMK